MKSIRDSFVFVSAILAIALVGPVCLIAMQEEDVSGGATGQDPASQEIAGEITPPPVEGTEPQFPVQLMGYDGATYIYQTDCCVDGHLGLVYSGTEISPLGCNVGTPSPGTAMTLPDSTFGKQHKGQTETKLVIGVADSLTNPSTLPSATPSYQNNFGSFADYYGNASFMATTVGLHDENDVTRYYNLVRMISKGKSTNGETGAVRSFQYEIPVLFLTRLAPDRQYTSGGQVVVVAPVKQIDVVDPVEVDLTQSHAEWITIKLPDPTTGDLMEVVCLLINRPAQ